MGIQKVLKTILGRLNISALSTYIAVTATLLLGACQLTNSSTRAPTQPVVISQLPPSYNTPVVSNQDTITPDQNAVSTDVQISDTASDFQDTGGGRITAGDTNMALQVPTTPLTTNDVIGVWRLQTESESCTLSLALTQWTGGYRANTLQCTGNDVAQIKSWNLEGQEVIVKDASGVPIAGLKRVAVNRLEGSLPGGRSMVILR